MTYSEFLDKLSNPAKGALMYEGIDSFEALAAMSRAEILAMHGMGPKSLPLIEECLAMVGKSLRADT